MLYISCSDNNPSAPALGQGDQITNTLDKKPAPNLIGTMDLTFDLTAVVPDDPVWIGTITFDGYGTYGIRFFHTGGEVRGQANHFEEIFEIYDQTDPTIVYLSGPDAGVVALANKPPEDTKFMANGEVEFATGDFEGWMGRKTHMSGVVTWQVLNTPNGVVEVPSTVPDGTFRIN
ncbi:MAG: hypothetical protein P8X47_10805 [Ignavibacteriaceae bacterium]